MHVLLPAPDGPTSARLWPAARARSVRSELSGARRALNAHAGIGGGCARVALALSGAPRTEYTGVWARCGRVALAPTGADPEREGADARPRRLRAVSERDAIEAHVARLERGVRQEAEQVGGVGRVLHLRCNRGAAEMPPRCSRGAAEMQPRWSEL